MSPARNLEYIKNGFRLSVSGLARMFGVSRQAIYDWRSGKAVSPENAARLSDMARATDVLIGACVELSPHLLRRTITSGKNLLELVRDGASAESSALMLVSILRAEASQRERLLARMNGRRPYPIDFSEAGIPMLEELD